MARHPDLPALSRSPDALWPDVLPGLIAAGLLAAAETRFSTRPALLVPLAGGLAAFTVYFGDHRISGTGTRARTWAVIWGAGLLLGGLLFFCGAFRLPIMAGYVLLALGYVLGVPGVGRLQDVPWLRVLLVAAGWGAVPLTLQSTPLTLEALVFCAATSAFFLAGVMWSDAADLQEDARSGRPTPAHTLSEFQRLFLTAAASLLSIGLYFHVRTPGLAAGPILGIFLLPWLRGEDHARHADLLLLTPLLWALGQRML